MKNILRNIFTTVGIGTLIFTPMILFDNGLNDTMKSVLIWLFASILYGLSFEILKLKTFFRIPLHFLTCFLITFGIRTAYSLLVNFEVNFKKLLIITLLIFIVIYVLLYFLMKYLNSPDNDKVSEEE